MLLLPAGGVLQLACSMGMITLCFGVLFLLLMTVLPPGGTRRIEAGKGCVAVVGQ